MGRNRNSAWSGRPVRFGGRRPVEPRGQSGGRIEERLEDVMLMLSMKGRVIRIAQFAAMLCRPAEWRRRDVPTRHAEAGFTLVEMLVVITIIGLVMSLV